MTGNNFPLKTATWVSTCYNSVGMRVLKYSIIFTVPIFISQFSMFNTSEFSVTWWTTQQIRRSLSSTGAFMTPALIQQSVKLAANLNGYNCTISKYTYSLLRKWQPLNTLSTVTMRILLLFLILDGLCQLTCLISRSEAPMASQIS